MPPTTPSPPASVESRDTPGGRRPDALQLILLVAQDTRRQWLRALVGRIDPQCRLENASCPVDASLRLARGRAHLLVLDLAFEPGRSLALIHHLARIAPSTSIVAFDESATPLPIRPYDAWCWHDAHTVLRRSIDTLRRNNPTSPPSAPQATP